MPFPVVTSQVLSATSAQTPSPTCLEQRRNSGSLHRRTRPGETWGASPTAAAASLSYTFLLVSSHHEAKGKMSTVLFAFKTVKGGARAWGKGGVCLSVYLSSGKLSRSGWGPFPLCTKAWPPRRQKAMLARHGFSHRGRADRVHPYSLYYTKLILSTM